jgi:excisionase family DNA binding protein
MKTKTRLGVGGRRDHASIRRSRSCLEEMENRVTDADRRRGADGLPSYHAIKSVAAALDVSTRTVRRWIATGDLIVHRVNGVVRISDADLRAFLALHRES